MTNVYVNNHPPTNREILDDLIPKDYVIDQFVSQKSEWEPDEVDPTIDVLKETRLIVGRK